MHLVAFAIENTQTPKLPNQPTRSRAPPPLPFPRAPDLDPPRASPSSVRPPSPGPARPHALGALGPDSPLVFFLFLC